MTATRVFWQLLMGGTLGLYLVLLWGLFLTPAAGIAAEVLGFLLLLHLAEMKTALRVGRAKGVLDRRIIWMTLVFGFTWWVPMGRGII